MSCPPILRCEGSRVAGIPFGSDSPSIPDQLSRPFIKFNFQKLTKELTNIHKIQIKDKDLHNKILHNNFDKTIKIIYKIFTKVFSTKKKKKTIPNEPLISFQDNALIRSFRSQKLCFYAKMKRSSLLDSPKLACLKNLSIRKKILLHFEKGAN